MSISWNCTYSKLTVHNVYFPYKLSLVLGGSVVLVYNAFVIWLMPIWSNQISKHFEKPMWNLESEIVELSIMGPNQALLNNIKALKGKWHHSWYEQAFRPIENRSMRRNIDPWSFGRCCTISFICWKPEWTFLCNYQMDEPFLL